MRRVLATILTAGLVAACTAADDDPDTPQAPDDPVASADLGPGAPVVLPDDVELVASLVPFGACDDLLDHLRDAAAELVGPYGLEDGTLRLAVPAFGMDVVDDAAGDRAVASPEAGAQELAADAGMAPAAGPGETGTNVQEAGVDEPDVVKTDGQRLFTVRGTTLHVLDVAGDAPEELATLDLGDAWGAELLLAGDRLLVTTTGHDVRPFATSFGEAAGRDDAGGAAAADPGDAGGTDARADVGTDVEPAGDAEIALLPPMGSAATTLTVLDVSDPTDPRPLEQLAVDGTAVASRLIDGVVRLVLTSPPAPDLAWHHPTTSGLRGEQRATEANLEVVRGSTIEDWLPWAVHTTADGTTSQGTLVPCDQVARPAAFSGLGLLSVLTLDPSAGLAGYEDATTSVLAAGDLAYASSERLYVGTTRWREPVLDRPMPEPGQPDLPVTDLPAVEPDAPADPDGSAEPDGPAADPDGATSDQARPAPATTTSAATSTELHAFELAPDRARHVASAEVPGTLLSQWAMSEHDGHLRVASTVGDPWSAVEPSQSVVTVLAVGDDELEKVGQVDGLGVTERIYAVRFLGDVGYVVTFRETDPLYTLDLRDPTDPRVTGELKITGYSAYLHPLGDDLLLGVGQDATEQGMTTGTQLSLFDVSDPGDPRVLDQLDLAGAASDVEHDHRAFLHWPATGLTVVPYLTWGMPVLPDELATDDGAGADPSFVEPEVDAGALAVTTSRADGLVERTRLRHDTEVTGDPTGTRDAAEPDVLRGVDPWQARILRSLVVDDRLVTVSDLGVAVHGLDDLDERGFHRFAGPAW